MFFDDRLPALFVRVLDVVEWAITAGGFDWVFTGPRAAVTVRVRTDSIQLVQRFYDSFALVDPETQQLNHPEKMIEGERYTWQGPLRTLAVTLDAGVGLVLRVNNEKVCRLTWLYEFHRHQLTGRELEGSVTGMLLQPGRVESTITVTPAQRYQQMIGFGGSTIPMAYNQLSEEGKAMWWRLLDEYNLRLHREYPMGAHLNIAMDNWDRTGDAVPHYYGDNFPNSEVSDFDYLKRLRSMGGTVMFEFWGLPMWLRIPDAQGEEYAVDCEKYAAAIVRYCEVSRARVGFPPDIVGIQNEKAHTTATFHGMTLALRRALDAAGFQAVKIHMADSGWISWPKGGMDYLGMFKERSDVWALIDYSAVHMYDYQDCLANPDEYDAALCDFRAGAEEKPFLATELCVNYGRYQTDSYRLAFQMGQLYHKNLVLANATAIAYCWLLLNVEQPSYGWTRSLFVPDDTNGNIPVASSAQLRVFGAYSRCIQAGMTRVAAECDNPDLLVTAFRDDSGKHTLVVLNRSLREVGIQIDWADAVFTTSERCDPYSPNQISTGDQRLVPPGGILTLTNVK